MNILNRCVLEVKVGDRAYRLECSNDSPLAELRQVLDHMAAFVDEKVKAAEQQTQSEEPGVTEIKPEEVQVV